MSSSFQSAVAQQVLEFLRQEGQKPHSADELAGLLQRDRGEVDRALEELQGAGLVASEAVTGYGGSDTLWRISTS
ncbi:MarR family transcriptional regulator [Deinococcus malanensis]|nr:MarR family transcriptional regulator [Deinococcus malanensis]